MIQLTGAGKRFGHKLLFEDLDWLITPKERAGLVGANGTGKSTLLKVLAGIESLDYGSSDDRKGVSAGYLPQDGLTLSGTSVFAECMAVFADLRDIEEELESLTHRMGEIWIRPARNTAGSRIASIGSTANFVRATDTPSRPRSALC